MANILPDSLNRIQPQLDLTVQPVAPSKQVSEALSRLSTGQRVFAEILTALPNGTYRAVVNQRDLVLSLPFSAKSGDSLELQVVNTDGHVAFAVVPKSPAPTQAAAESAPATLSPAARLISQLLGEATASPGNAKPLPLAGGAPLLAAPPPSGAVLAPALQGAVESSGLFYEAHQARWLEGGLQLSSLQAEPQNQQRATLESSGQSAVGTAGELANDASADQTTLTAGRNGVAAAMQHPAVPSRSALPPPAIASGLPEATDSLAAAPGSLALQGPLSLTKELAPVVQQQLQALANGTHSWQGQVWPGQQMEWEIIEDEPQRRQGDTGSADGNPWRTRLRLVLPTLGEVVADLRLQRDSVDVRLIAPTSASRLGAETGSLQDKLALAGMSLATLTVDSHDG